MGPGPIARQSRSVADQSPVTTPPHSMNQHYVPVFYMKPWKNKQHKLLCYFAPPNKYKESKKRGASYVEKKQKTMTKMQQNKYKGKFESWSSNAHVFTLEAILNPDNKYDLTSHQDFINAMDTLTWWIEDFSDANLTLLSSDSPMRLIPLLPINEDSLYSRANALNSKKFFCYIPLSPTIGFFAAPDKLCLPKSKSSLIKMMNMDIVKAAKQFVIAYSCQHELFVKKHLSHLIE